MADGYQELTLETLKTTEGVKNLCRMINELYNNMGGDGQNVRILNGYGSPEGVVTASVGSLYLRKDGTTDTTLYRKETGTGGTGWVAVVNFSLPLSIANGGTGSTTGGNYLVPSGGIILWSGTIATIPSGWVLCNGSNGTPDLRNRFIVAADADSGGVAKSTVTGSALQTSDGLMPAHTHTVTASSGFAEYGEANTNILNRSGSINTGSYGTGTKVIAVFYALAYIMKT
jgi:hypothetical protein